MAEAPCTPARQESVVERLIMCPICHGQLNNVSITHCGHRFCTQCIIRWITEGNTCPNCRQILSNQNLILDRDFEELIGLLNERSASGAPEATGEGQEHQNQPPQSEQTGGFSADDLRNILQSVMPQRDQDLRNLTDNLLAMKDREIERLEAIKQELTTTTEQLRRDIERLVQQVDNELPGLRERLREFQEKVDRKRQQKQQLKDKVQELETDVTSARTDNLQTCEQKNYLQENLDQANEELQENKEQLEESKEEIVKLKMEIQSLNDASTAKQTQLNKSESDKAQMKLLLDRLLQQKQMSDAEIGKVNQQCLQYQQQTQRLQVYEGMYKEREQELKSLRDHTLPTKDMVIFHLNTQTTDLINQLSQLRQTSIPTQEHQQILQSEIERKSSYFDQEYGSRISRAEQLNEGLQKRVSELENELKCRENVGDDLKSATRTYKKLLNENSEFHDTLSKKEKEIKRLKQELARSKERTYTLERKISLNSSIPED